MTIIALAAGGTTLAFWLAFGKPFDFSLERTVTVMVITCPHALGLAVPLVVAVSTALAAANGLLIRDRSAFERARNVQAVVFDKTGTLTEGRFGVSDIIASVNETPTKYSSWQPVWKANRSIRSRRHRRSGRRKRHPVSRAGRSFERFPAVERKRWSMKHPLRPSARGYLKENDLRVDDEHVRKAADEGKTVVYVLVNDQIEGAIALADIIRRESREALSFG